MKVTEKQVAVIEFVARNPQATIEQIDEGAGMPLGYNTAHLITQMIDSGFLQLVVTSDVDAVLNGDADEHLSDAAEALYNYFEKKGRF